MNDGKLGFRSRETVVRNLRPETTGFVSSARKLPPEADPSGAEPTKVDVRQHLVQELGLQAEGRQEVGQQLTVAELREQQQPLHTTQRVRSEPQVLEGSGGQTHP